MSRVASEEWVVMVADAVAAALAAGLSELVVGTDQVLPAEGQLANWELPADDRQALSQWGLPMLERGRLVANIQAGDQPAIEHDGRTLYSLGIFGKHELGATSGSGEVWAIPMEPAMSASYVNATVAVFVDVAWRWYRIEPEIVRMRFDIAQYDKLDAFLDYVRRLDPKAADEPSSLWNGIVATW